MQTNDKATAEQATADKKDTGFKNWDDFMASRETEGVTGDPSPNAPNMLNLIDLTRSWINTGPGTEQDAVFVMVKVKGGDCNGKPAMLMQMAVNGTPDDIVQGLANAFIQEPKMLAAAERAISHARAHLLGDSLSHLADFLKGKR